MLNLQVAGWSGEMGRAEGEAEGRSVGPLRAKARSQ